MEGLMSILIDSAPSLMSVPVPTPGGGGVQPEASLLSAGLVGLGCVFFDCVSSDFLETVTDGDFLVAALPEVVAVPLPVEFLSVVPLIVPLDCFTGFPFTSRTTGD